MNVLVVPSWYPNGKDMLMGVYHKEYCEALVKKNIKVNMLFIERERLNNPLKYLFMKKSYVIQEKGYKTYVKRMLNVEKISFHLQMKLYTKALEKAFKKYLKNNPKPDILHAQVTIPAGYAVSFIGKKYKIPVVVTEHASYFRDFFKEPYVKYTKYALEDNYFTTVSKFMLQDLPSYITKMDVIPNLVDTDKFNLPRKKIKGLRIVSICAFRKGKRIEDLLAALNIIINEKRIKDVKLTIIGDGYLKEFYQNKCHELKLDSYVDFVGRKSKEEIIKILNQHNIFAIASVRETFCIPAIEALASGLPVVSTKCLGPEEYITDKCGKLVEVGDIHVLALAIIDVYNKIDSYQIQDLRDIASKYNCQNVIAKSIKIYEKMINEVEK